MRLPQVAAVACLSVLLECNLPLPSASAASTDTVQRVVDGDTLITEQAGRVRLIGLNAPETVSPAQKQGAPPGCYGPQASEYLKAVLPPNSRVRLETDVEAQDKFGRTLAYVYTEVDGTPGTPLFVNAVLIEGGYARAQAFPPNTQFKDQFKRLEAQAKAERRGLWGDICMASAPSESPTGKATSGARSILAVEGIVVDRTSMALPSVPKVLSSSAVASPLRNPGDSKNCADFGSYEEAKGWYDRYFPQFGDVAKLDGDGDGIPCESLRRVRGR